MYYGHKVVERTKQNRRKKSVVGLRSATLAEIEFLKKKLKQLGVHVVHKTHAETGCKFAYNGVLNINGKINIRRQYA
ncbi:MAG: hypothetical protein HRT61_00625 [Ekhidna sp.]|nr:hypothetical protein [Ekhidna sp.]